MALCLLALAFTLVPSNSPKVRILEPRDGRKIHSFNTGLGDLPRGEHPLGLGVEEKGHHHGRVEGGVASLLIIGVEDRGQIQLLYDKVTHEMGSVALLNELRDFWRQQPLLFGVPGAKMFGHTYSSYSTAKS